MVNYVVQTIGTKGAKEAALGRRGSVCANQHWAGEVNLENSTLWLLLGHFHGTSADD
jgi:hypothetical protein